MALCIFEAEEMAKAFRPCLTAGFFLSRKLFSFSFKMRKAYKRPGCNNNEQYNYIKFVH